MQVFPIDTINTVKQGVLGIRDTRRYIKKTFV